LSPEPGIYLLRKNILKQYVSGVIKNKRKISHSDIKPENVTINLNTNGLVKELDKNIKYNELMKKCFKNNPRLEISYESFFSDPQKNLINIFDFISIKPCDVQLPRMVKLTDDNLGNIIENYNEVYLTLCNTKYSDYLK